MKKSILIILAVSLLLMTSLFAWNFFTHLAMPFNEEGKYFDEQNLTVYEDKSVLVYGLFTTLGFVLTIFIFMICKRENKKS